MKHFKNLYMALVLFILTNPAFAQDAAAKINNALSQITNVLTAISGAVGILALTWGAVNYMAFKNPISDTVKRVALGGLIIAAAAQLVNLFLGSGSGIGF